VSNSFFIIFEKLFFKYSYLIQEKLYFENNFSNIMMFELLCLVDSMISSFLWMLDRIIS